MDKENTNKIKRSYLLMLVVISLAVIAGLILSIISLFINDLGFNSLLITISDLVMYIGILYYALEGYKKPHGNSIKYLMLLFALCRIFFIYIQYSILNDFHITLVVVATSMITYMAGRLAKIKKNVWICGLITILLIVHTLGYMFFVASLEGKLGILSISSLSPLITWLALNAAYFARYIQHREAGLESD